MSALLNRFSSQHYSHLIIEKDFETLFKTHSILAKDFINDTI